MANIERYGGGMSSRDARALDRSLSAVRVGTVTDLAVIDSAGRKWEEIMEISDQLTQQAMVSAVRVAQAEAAGAQIAPHAVRRLSYLADQHAMNTADIIDRAHRDLGRLA